MDAAAAHERAATDKAPPAFCPACGAALRAGQRFCEQCGAAVVTEAPPPVQPPAAQPPDQSDVEVGAWTLDPDAVAWTIRMPLITNRFFLWDMLRVVGITLLVVQVAIVLVGLLAGEGIFILPWPVYAISAAVFLVVALFVALVVYGNHFTSAFAVDSHGVAWETGMKERSLTRAAFLAGLLSGSPSAIAAGTVAISTEAGTIAWRDVYRVRIRTRERVVSISNSWRTAVRLYCTPETFDDVAARARAGVAAGTAWRAAHPATRVGARSVAPYVAWIVLAVVATVLTRAWSWAGEESELPVLIAVSMVITAGLVGRTGWILAIVSALASLYTLLIFAAEAGESNESIFGGTYYTYEFDTGLFWVSIAGTVMLLLMSLLVIIGRGPYRWRRVEG